MTGTVYGLEKKLDLLELGSPPRLLLKYEELKHDVVENDIDICVIGSGAAGAIIADKLAESGRNVVLLEKGGYYYPPDMNQREIDMLALLWKNAAAMFTDDLHMIVAQGQCLGGSTVINDAVCMWTPAIVTEQWRSMGVGITDRQWISAIAEVWSRLGVNITRDFELNANNRRLKEACERMGYRGLKNPRNCVDCKQCGFCHLGCHYGTKRDMLETYIKDAVGNSGIKIYCNCSVQKITYTHDSNASGLMVVDGVEGNFVDNDGNTRHKIRVNAKVVVVSAGAIASPQILLKSNIALGKTGKWLSFHPASYLLAKFEEEINAYDGIPMAFTCHQFGVTNGVAQGGFLIESVFLPIFQFSLGVPWRLENPKYEDLMRNFAHYAMAGVMIRDYEPKGELCLSDLGNPKIHHTLSEKDRENLANGLKTLARMWFKIGAQHIITGHTDKIKLERENMEHDIDSLVRLVQDKKGIEGLQLASAHPQGGNRMGEDSSKCVVDSNCKVHGFHNLFVCDASVFPTAVGVNPQITIMALATMTADRIARQWAAGDFENISLKKKLGETCHISQPMYCSAENVDLMFNQRTNQYRQQVLVNSSKRAPSGSGYWYFDTKTLMIYNDIHWMGFFPKDATYSPFHNFGKFWKRFYQGQDGTVKGKVHPLAFRKEFENIESIPECLVPAFLSRSGWTQTTSGVEFENTAYLENHPAYGQVIRLEYKELPFIYDLLKIVNEDTVLGKMFLGWYPDGIPIFTFSMSRNYNVEFMTEFDHEKIFTDFSRVPTRQEIPGRWIVKWISDSSANPEIKVLTITNGNNLGQLQLPGAFTELVNDMWRRLALLGIELPSFFDWQLYFKLVNRDFLVLKWCSPPIPQLPLRFLPDNWLEDVDGQRRFCLRFSLRREGAPCQHDHK